MCTYVPKYYISTTFSLVSGRFLTMFALLQQASKGLFYYICLLKYLVHVPEVIHEKKIYLTYTNCRIFLMKLV